MASQPNGTLYTGMSSNLVQRLWQHKNNMVEGFTDKYNVKHLAFTDANSLRMSRKQHPYGKKERQTSNR